MRIPNHLLETFAAVALPYLEKYSVMENALAIYLFLSSSIPFPIRKTLLTHRSLVLGVYA
jgi:hypothetical protein